MTYFRIKVPKSLTWDSNRVIALQKALLQLPYRLELSISTNGNEIAWGGYVYDDPEPDIERIRPLVHSYYPGAVVFEPTAYQPEYPAIQRSIWFPVTEDKEVERARPFLGAAEIKATTDPLALVASAMGEVLPGEILEWRLVFNGVQFDAFAPETIEEMLTATRWDMGERPRGSFWPQSKGSFFDNVAEGWRKGREKQRLQEERVSLYAANEEQILRAKLSEPTYAAALIVLMATNNRQRLDQVLGTISALVSNYVYPQHPLLGQPIITETELSSYDDYIEKDPSKPFLALQEFEEVFGKALVMSASETGAFWHLPHQAIEAPKISWVASRQAPLPPEVKALETGLVVGVNRYGGAEEPVKLPLDDRTTHTMIIGKTGMGKSSLLHRMIHEDIHQGRGLCLVDPHGDLVADILKSSIPDERIDDVVVLDLSMQVDGKRYPPPFNPLYQTAVGPQTGTLMSILARIYAGFGTSKMARYLKMALTTLESEEKPTIWDVRRVFRDYAYRENLVAQHDSFNLPVQWQEYDGERESDRENSLAALFSRLDQFFDSNQLLAITCHPDPLDMWQLVQERKIILVSVGEKGNRIAAPERQILGSAVVSQIEAAAKSGAIPPGAENSFVLYVDETQTFVSTPIDKMLAEVRKANLGLVLANQFISQLTGDIQAALEGTVGSMICFEMGKTDAREMATHMAPAFAQEDLIKLGKFKAVVSMRVGEERTPAFSLHTLPPPTQELDPEEASARERQVRLKSIQNYSPKTQKEVLDWLRQKYVSGASQAPPAKDGADGDEFIEPA